MPLVLLDEAAWQQPPRALPRAGAPVLSVQSFEGSLDWLLEHEIWPRSCWPLFTGDKPSACDPAREAVAVRRARQLASAASLHRYAISCQPRST